MGSFSTVHWMVVAVVVLVLFGRGKLSETMADFGKGISSFRKGMSEGVEPAKPETAMSAPMIMPPAAEAVQAAESEPRRP